MAIGSLEAFNAVGGYTVSIPPIQLIDTSGNITSPHVTTSNLTVSGNAAVSGDITATNFYGNVQGNIEANIIISGDDKGVLYNNNGTVTVSQGLSFNNASNALSITGDLSANSLALGTGENQFYSVTSLIATTSSGASDQVLHRVLANTVCGIEYTVIATDTNANIRQISKLNAIVLNSDVGYIEFGTAVAPSISPDVGDFKVSFAAGGPNGNVILTVTPYSANSTQYKIIITSFKA